MPNEVQTDFLVTVNCDELHPDDIEGLKHSLETSRYDFKVEVRTKLRKEDYPELLVIGVRTTLLVRFSTNWMLGRTQRGGVKSVVNAVDETLDNSSHDRNRKPTVGVGPDGGTIITTEEAARGRKKQKWSLERWVAVISLIIAFLTLVGAFVIPEVRQWLRLEKKEAAKVESQTPQTVLQNPVTPTQSVDSSKSIERPTQKTKTHVKGGGNVAGNNVAGNDNVTGNGNTTAPTASAPNGIAISGGNVTSPTVNNITALPDLTMSGGQEKQVTDSIAQTFAGVEVSITEVQPSQNTRDFSERLARMLKASGATVELSSASYYVPPAGQTLHKGMSIVSFPGERKSLVDGFVNALGSAKTIQFVPIYKREDKKVSIVVNRSMDTPEEGKQY